MLSPLSYRAVAPAAGFEPAFPRLTAACITIMLRRNGSRASESNRLSRLQGGRHHRMTSHGTECATLCACPGSMSYPAFRRSCALLSRTTSSPEISRSTVRSSPSASRGSSWGGRIRTPINGSRARCPTVERRPNGSGRRIRTLTGGSKDHRPAVRRSPIVRCGLRDSNSYHGDGGPGCCRYTKPALVRWRRLELPSPGWHPDILPLNYHRKAAPTSLWLLVRRFFGAT